MYKMIIIDLDGTLLNDEKEVSREDIYTINRAYKEKGVISVIATGRSYVCAEYLANLIGEGISQYIIANTGSIIRDNRKKTYLCEVCISISDTIKILETAKKYNLNCIIDTNSKVISNHRLVNQDNLKKIGQPFEIIKEDLINYVKNNNIETVQMTVIGSENNLLKLKEDLNNLENIEITELCKSKNLDENKIEELTYVDIMRRGITKKKAIETLAKYQNINKGEIIVIGDGGNDIPMFETGGLKVAMGNALDIVKEKADYITASNNENGVSKAIRKFVFNEDI